MNEMKQRHGCVSSWLWIVLIINVILCVVYIYWMFDKRLDTTNVLCYGIASVFSVANVLSSILLMRWNKMGFYLFCVSTIVVAIIYALVINHSFVTFVSTSLGVFIWVAILQIRKNGVSAWSLMEKGWDYKHCRHLYQVFGTVMLLLLILTFVVIATRSTSSDVSDDDEQTEEIVAQDDDIVWTEHSDSRNMCSVEVPSDFREVELNEDQILGLACTDYDPAVTIIQESCSTVESLGINSPEEYIGVFVKSHRRSNSGTDFKKISEELYKGTAYIYKYDMTIDDTEFRYYAMATKTDSNYYCCLVFCLKEYADGLQTTIDHILDSFKAKS